jgi:predicted enzyme related to lactoylglutathione lyase
MSEKQPTFGNGKICYLEIPANDIDASSSFYHNSFGWKLRKKEVTVKPLLMME